MIKNKIKKQMKLKIILKVKSIVIKIIKTKIKWNTNRRTELIFKRIDINF